MAGALTRAAVLLVAAASAGAAPAPSCCRWRHVDRGLLPATYVLSLAVDRRDGSVLYAGTIARGIAKSVDGGERWRPTGGFPLLADGAVPRAPDVMSLAAHPSEGGTVYAGTNFGGVLKSVDGGATWTTANRGLAAPSYRFLGARVFNPVVSLVADPRTPPTLYAAATGVGVFVTRDGAAHWRPLASGLAERRVESLALARGVLYAATSNGVFRTSGGRWRRSGLRGHWLETIAVDAQRPQTLYAGSLREGVFTSRDGGRSWTSTNAGLGNLYVRTLLAAGGRVYAGTYGGVFASRDAGRTWAPLNDGLRNRLVQALALRLGSPPTLYAGTLGAGVYSVHLQAT